MFFGFIPVTSRGRQKRVLTPGDNQKRNVAGALTIGSGSSGPP